MAQNDHTIYPKAWMIYWGTLNKGFHFYGPFKSYDEAHDWKSIHLHVGTITHIFETNDVRQDLCKRISH